MWHCVEPEAEEAASNEVNSLLEEDDHSLAWKVKHALETGNSFDIYTVEWTACGSFIAAGLSDDSCRVYSLKNGSIGGQCIKIVRDHQHFVNGINWDPIAHQHLITVSNDRSFKVTKVASSSKRITFIPLAKIHKMQDSPSSEGFKLFHDESLGSFFRKPDFTPDGAYCYVPGGCLSNGANCVHVWMRNAFSLNNPLFSIGGFEKPTVGVFFCRGWKWRVREGGDWEWVFCVLTTDEVHVFGSGDQVVPLWVGKNFHLSVLTDASWRGSRLIVTSTDGFASVFSFGWASLEVADSVNVNAADNVANSQMDSVLDSVNYTANVADSQLDSQMDSVIDHVADSANYHVDSVLDSQMDCASMNQTLTSEQSDCKSTLVPASDPVSSTHKKRITPTLITTLQ